MVDNGDLAARGKEFRPHLNVVVGGDYSDESEDLQDMRSRMQSFAMNVDDGGMPDSTVFIEDSDVMLPSTSHAGSTLGELHSSSLRTCSNTLENPASGTDMGIFVKDFFDRDMRLTQLTNREAETNFLEEVFSQKPPKILENYLFGNVIGEGSYSKVKEVVHVRTLERRAVKIIKDRRLRKIPGGEQNVQKEIEVLQRLNHPNVVKVFEIFRLEEKQKLYIVMEFCVCSLQQMLDNCPEKMLPEFQAHLYFTQLIEGLDFLHSQRIIHKDIKPGNLLLSLDGILKICDLGVAELLDGAAGDREWDWCTLVQGTPKFQPPEVVSGTQKRFRGRLVDIWACGVTLYNFVSGCYPFDGDVIMKLFENITTAPLKLPPNISKPLEQLLTGILQKEPNKRWDSLKIRSCSWWKFPHKIDKQRIVQVPDHGPSDIYDYLAQLYADEEEDVEQQNGVASVEDVSHRNGQEHMEKAQPSSSPPTNHFAAIESISRPGEGGGASASQQHFDTEMNPILAQQSSRKTSRTAALAAEGRRINITRLIVILCSFITIIIFVVVLALFLKL